MRWASHETANGTAHHRYCCYRESDRKLDPSRYTVRVFGPFLPLLYLFSSLNQYQFQKEEPPWVQNFMSAHGTVESARVITDKFTGQSRGFGFVEMATQEEAKAAITALNGSQMDGRPLTVNEAKPQEPRTGGGGGGGGRFGGGGGGDRGGRGRF